MNPTTTPIHGITALPSLGIISARGPDAASFLHGQLTQDFLGLDLTQARLAAFCSPKGRMLASFTGFKRSAEEILLVCSADILAATLKRLGMFVLRAKVQLSDASAEYTLYGLVGDAPTNTPWAKLDLNDANLVCLPPAAGQNRALWCAPANQPAPQAQPLEPALWQWLEVQAGIAPITAPIVDAFVPQMLNYESVGGVNFKKGCYPGQEVVARSQFRGTLKRRGYLAHVAAEPFVGQEVFQADDAEQPCGLVATCAAHPNGGFTVIVSMQVAAASHALHLGSSIGASLTLQTLPYALLEDI